MPAGQRKRRTVACNICRSRRTKCDGAKPRCSYCQANDLECQYRDTLQQPTQLETDIGDIKDRLDQITGLLTATKTGSVSQVRIADHGLTNAEPVLGASTPITSATPVSPGGFISDYDSSTFPVMTIQSRPMMRLLGLGADTATWLCKVEQTAASPSGTGTTGTMLAMSKICLLQPNRIESALRAFSEKVHIWFPIFSAAFSSVVSNTLNKADSQPLESCLSLLVIAVGSLVELDDVRAAIAGRPDLPYVEAAMHHLPQVIQGYTLLGLQCLIMFAMHQMCLARPCQAHDYIAMASFRVQNMLRSRICEDDMESLEDLRRAFWAVLLIESELTLQLNLPMTGVWNFEDIPYPTASTTWHHIPSPRPEATPAAYSQPSCSPGSNTSTDSSTAYFLAEIAMRRMLQRCTTSVSKSASGQLRYAPVIAGELESQLNEWYDCLPAHLRFRKYPNGAAEVATNPNAQFLQIQYAACRASIFWPAVYQAIELGVVVDQQTRYCDWFAEAYLSFMITVSRGLKTCVVYTWTILASVFSISMAAQKAMQFPHLRDAMGTNVPDGLVLATEILSGMNGLSPSLDMLREIWGRTISNIEADMGNYNT